MKWVKRIWGVVFWSAAVLALLLFVLSMLGGNGESLKKSVEDIVSDALQAHATIQTLNRVSFFPDMAFDFEGLEVRSGTGGENDVLSVQSLRMAMSFWDMTFSAGRLKGFELMDAYAPPGLFRDYDLRIEEARLGHDTEFEAADFKANGRLNGQSFAVRLPVILQGTPQAPLYKFDSAVKIDLSWGANNAQLYRDENMIVIEPQTRGDDYCEMVQILLHMNLRFEHDCEGAQDP